MKNLGKGELLVIATAIISGFSIYLNKFAVSGMNAGAFVFLKAIVVSMLVLSVIVAFKKFESLKRLSGNDWKKLAIIGFTGGGLAFLLFFKGLALTSAANAGFLHKTMFAFAGLLAVIFLKEKIDKKLLIAGLLAFVALFALFSSQFSSFGFGDLMILAAVLVWSAELILSKKALERIDGNTVAFGRMFFGSIFILAYLAVSGEISGIAFLNASQLVWVLITSTLLTGYILTFYNGLKETSVSKATLILLAAIPITSMLSMLDAKPLGSLGILANIALLAVVLIAALNFEFIKSVFKRAFSWKT